MHSNLKQILKHTLLASCAMRSMSIRDNSYAFRDTNKAFTDYLLALNDKQSFIKLTPGMKKIVDLAQKRPESNQKEDAAENMEWDDTQKLDGTFSLVSRKNSSDQSRICLNIDDIANNLDSLKTIYNVTSTDDSGDTNDQPPRDSSPSLMNAPETRITSQEEKDTFREQQEHFNMRNLNKQSQVVLFQGILMSKLQFLQLMELYDGRAVNESDALQVRGCQVRGLKNGTNACFINASLLGLYFLPKFSDFILEKGDSEMMAAGPVFKALYCIMAGINSRCGFDEIGMVNELLNALNKATGSNFRRSHADDADEFIGMLLDTLSDEISKEAEKIISFANVDLDRLINPKIVERFRCADGTEKLRYPCDRRFLLENNFSDTESAIQADFADISLDKSDGPSCGVCEKRRTECKIYKAVARPSEYLFVKINRRNHDASYSLQRYEISEYIVVGGYRYKRLAAILFTQPQVPGGIGHYSLQLWKEDSGFYLIDDNRLYEFGTPIFEQDNYFTRQTSTGIYELCDIKTK
ncbi:hypothetical protein ENBRE01_0328 [Enteropsectra breve]|nr:hypothetical protein ENBRE01_0328 [Enteropsectra breve]